MPYGVMQFWWAFASAFLGAALCAGVLLLWNMEGALWEGGVFSTIGALAGSSAGWRHFGEREGRCRIEQP